MRCCSPTSKIQANKSLTLVLKDKRSCFSPSWQGERLAVQVSVDRVLLGKEHPRAEHLTCPSKRGVGVLLCYALSHEMSPHVMLYTPLDTLKANNCNVETVSGFERHTVASSPARAKNGEAPGTHCLHNLPKMWGLRAIF